MVTIFGSNTCYHCLKCKQLCESMQIEHEYLDVREREPLLRFLELFPDEDAIPQILWNDTHIGGHRELSTYINEYIINNYGEGEIQ